MWTHLSKWKYLKLSNKRKDVIYISIKQGKVKYNDTVSLVSRTFIKGKVSIYENLRKGKNSKIVLPICLAHKQIPQFFFYIFECIWDSDQLYSLDKTTDTKETWTFKIIFSCI